VCGLGLGAWGVGFGVWWRLKFRVEGFRSMVLGVVFGVWGLSFGVQGSMFRIQGFEFRVYGSGFKF